ncbi:aspartate/glutamate racemase family protein [Alicyclobacillus curvatus]|nr:aspartate/glutamate racemase family protein [Alicyclobacillus curvatus]
MQTVGILGGLGPLAGAHFYRRLVELTPAESDEDHIPVILVSHPDVPSRIHHLSGTGPSPVPKLTELCRQLEQLGARIIAVPSTTTSIYQAELSLEVNVPIISLIDEVTRVIATDGCTTESGMSERGTTERGTTERGTSERGISDRGTSDRGTSDRGTRIGIMGTTPTRTFAVYESAFARHGIQPLYPDDASQSDIMDVIRAVKGSQQYGSQGADGRPRGIASLAELAREVTAIASRPWAQTLDGILLGCTELPVLFPTPDALAAFPPKLKVFSSTDILATAVVRAACGSTYERTR